MNLSRIFFILISKTFLVGCINQKINVATLAINEIVKNHYVKNLISFDLIVYHRLENDINQLSSIVNSLMLESDASFTGKLLQLHRSSFTQGKLKLTQSAILFLDSREAFDELDKNVQLANKFTKKLTFLTYIASTEPLAIFSEFLHFQFYLNYDVDGSIQLSQIRLLNRPNCLQQHTQLINQFSSKSLKWKKPVALISEFTNFNGCVLGIGSLSIAKPWSYYTLHDNGSIDAFGSTATFFRTFGKYYNITIIFTPFDYVKQRFVSLQWFPEYTPIYVPFINGLTTPMSNPNQRVSETFFTYSYGFVIPHGELYTPFEKLLLPFDFDTWIWLLVFMVAGVVTIEVIKRTNKRIESFVFGRDVNTPILNLVTAIFGLGQIVLPRRNFARYLLMMFILFCLIMRTAYQGKMFEFLQKPMRKPAVKTIAEMIEKNFTLYCSHTDVEFFKSMDMFKE